MEAIAVIEGINRILHDALSARTEEELGRTCLAVAEEVTGSAIAFIGELNAEGRLEDIAISNPGWDACSGTIAHRHGRTPAGFEVRGLYGRVLEEGKPLLTNDPAHHTASVGLPEGHPPLTSFLGVPLLQQGRIVGLLGLGNRPGGFRPPDVETAEALGGAIVQALMRKRAEEEARSQAEWFRVTLGSIGDGVLTTDDAGRVTYLNQVAESLTGWSREDADGRTSGDVFSTVREDSRRPGDDIVSRVLREGRAIVLENHTALIARDGREIPIEDSAAPIKDDEGRVRGVVLVFHDVTEKRRAEEALRQSRDELERRVTERTAELARATETIEAERRRFVEVLDVLPAYVILLTPDYRVGFMNRMFRERFGDPENRHCYEYLFGRATPCEICESYKVLESGAPHRWDWTGPDGREYDIADIPFTDLDGSRMILEMGIDVTERKQAERGVAERTAEVQALVIRLRELALDLTEAEHRERRRVARVLHDHLQQLLAAAKLKVGFLRSRIPDAGLRAAAVRADELLEESIGASRTLVVELSPPVLQDAGLVAGLDWLRRRMKEQHGLEVELTSDDEVEPGGEDVRWFLFEAVRELLFNVVKHSGVLKASVSVCRAGDDLEIRVSDAGKGIGPIGDADRRPNESGFGLFSIGQRLQLLGGSLSFDSDAERGTSVTLRVPVIGLAIRGAAAASQPPGSAEAATRTGAIPPTGRIRVVLADDHRIVRQGFVALLGAEPDIEVVGEAADGTQAIELAHALRPQVVVMDVSMPGISGIEATRRLSALLPDVRVIGLSMHDGDEVASAMKEAGAVAYVTKDGPSDELLAAIRAARLKEPSVPAPGPSER